MQITSLPEGDKKIDWFQNTADARLALTDEPTS